MLHAIYFCSGTNTKRSVQTLKYSNIFTDELFLYRITFRITNSIIKSLEVNTQRTVKLTSLPFYVSVKLKLFLNVVFQFKINIRNKGVALVSIYV